MNRFVALAALCAALSPLAARAAEPKTEEEKTLYALGVIMGGRLKGLNLTEKDMKLVEDGFMDSALGKKEKVSLETYGPKVDAFAQSRQNAGAEKEKKAGLAYADKCAKESGAKKFDVDLGGGKKSFFVYKETAPGSGASPAATDKVKVNYEGKLPDGTVFDASAKHGGPAEFPLNGVIKCWTEGVQKMKVGAKATLTCPSDVAYGDRGHPPSIPGGATLQFNVELVAITK